jgi:hypothetical protein
MKLLLGRGPWGTASQSQPRNAIKRDEPGVARHSAARLRPSGATRLRQRRPPAQLPSGWRLPWPECRDCYRVGQRRCKEHCCGVGNVSAALSRSGERLCLRPHILETRCSNRRYERVAQPTRPRRPGVRTGHDLADRGAPLSRPRLIVRIGQALPSVCAADSCCRRERSSCRRSPHRRHRRAALR